MECGLIRYGVLTFKFNIELLLDYSFINSSLTTYLKHGYTPIWDYQGFKIRIERANTKFMECGLIRYGQIYNYIMSFSNIKNV